MTEPSAGDRHWMELAIELAWRCPPSEGAYSVGAVIVGENGQELARGYSREDDPHVHAEESALGKLADGDPRLRAATIYSTLEPCSQRKSRPRSCTELILAAGIGRVVMAWREPGLFVADCRGCELLTEAGVTVIELPDAAERAQAANAHLRFDQLRFGGRHGGGQARCSSRQNTSARGCGVLHDRESPVSIAARCSRRRTGVPVPGMSGKGTHPLARTVHLIPLPFPAPAARSPGWQPARDRESGPRRHSGAPLTSADIQRSGSCHCTIRASRAAAPDGRVDGDPCASRARNREAPSPLGRPGLRPCC